MNLNSYSSYSAPLNANSKVLRNIFAIISASSNSDVKSLLVSAKVILGRYSSICAWNISAIIINNFN